jgi:hypothetical protein
LVVGLVMVGGLAMMPRRGVMLFGGVIVMLLGHWAFP